LSPREADKKTQGGTGKPIEGKCGEEDVLDNTLHCSSGPCGMACGELVWGKRSHQWHDTTQPSTTRTRQPATKPHWPKLKISSFTKFFSD